MRRVSCLLFIFGCILLADCAGKQIESYEGKEPRLHPERFFNGYVTGYGFSETRFGRIRDRFRADFRGEKQGDTYVWNETLRFEDGRVEERVWKVVPRGEQRYTVEATGMVGEGIGVAYGNAVQWNYYLNQEIGGNEWTFYVDDWMFKQDEKTLIVRATFKKFGITVGRATMFLRKVN